MKNKLTALGLFNRIYIGLILPLVTFCVTFYWVAYTYKHNREVFLYSKVYMLKTNALEWLGLLAIVVFEIIGIYLHKFYVESVNTEMHKLSVEAEKPNGTSSLTELLRMNSLHDTIKKMRDSSYKRYMAFGGVCIVLGYVCALIYTATQDMVFTEIEAVLYCVGISLIASKVEQSFILQIPFPHYETGVDKTDEQEQDKAR